MAVLLVTICFGALIALPVTMMALTFEVISRLID
mgnify:CR=1 FL=1